MAITASQIPALSSENKELPFAAGVTGATGLPAGLATWGFTSGRVLGLLKQMFLDASKSKKIILQCSGYRKWWFARAAYFKKNRTIVQKQGNKPAGADFWQGYTVANNHYPTVFN